MAEQAPGPAAVREPKLPDLAAAVRPPQPACQSPGLGWSDRLPSQYRSFACLYGSGNQPNITWSPFGPYPRQFWPV